jgi:hypothetical protein
MNNLDKMKEARLKKCLNNLYDFGNKGIMPLGQFFDKFPPINKSIYIPEYSSKRICLEYKKLENPKPEYYLWYSDTNCIHVPKLVFDAFEVPDRVYVGR